MSGVSVSVSGEVIVNETQKCLAAAAITLACVPTFCSCFLFIVFVKGSCGKLSWLYPLIFLAHAKSFCTVSYRVIALVGSSTYLPPGRPLLQEDSARRQKAFTEWESIYSRLLLCLRQGVTSCVVKGKLPPTCRDRYFVSGVNQSFSLRTTLNV